MLYCFLNKYPVGKDVTVYYEANNPFYKKSGVMWGKKLGPGGVIEAGNADHHSGNALLEELYHYESQNKLNSINLVVKPIVFYFLFWIFLLLLMDYITELMLNLPKQVFIVIIMTISLYLLNNYEKYRLAERLQYNAFICENKYCRKSFFTPKSLDKSDLICPNCNGNKTSIKLKNMYLSHFNYSSLIFLILFALNSLINYAFFWSKMSQFLIIFLVLIFSIAIFFVLALQDEYKNTISQKMSSITIGEIVSSEIKKNWKFDLTKSEFILIERLYIVYQYQIERNYFVSNLVLTGWDRFHRDIGDVYRELIENYSVGSEVVIFYDESDLRYKKPLKYGYHNIGLAGFIEPTTNQQILIGNSVLEPYHNTGLTKRELIIKYWRQIMIEQHFYV